MYPVAANVLHYTTQARAEATGLKCRGFLCSLIVVELYYTHARGLIERKKKRGEYRDEEG